MVAVALFAVWFVAIRPGGVHAGPGSSSTTTTAPGSLGSASTATTAPAVTAATTAPAVTALARLDDVAPVVLDRPPFPQAAAVPSGTPSHQLVVDSQKDRAPGTELADEKWLVDNGISVPLASIAPIDASSTTAVARDIGRQTVDLPKSIPRSYHGHPLLKVISLPEQRFLLYGSTIHISGTTTVRSSYLVAVDAQLTNVLYAYDFSNYAYPPERATLSRFGTPLEADDVFEGITWAAQVGRTLYVSHAYGGYAAHSKGMNGYLTAIDLDTNMLQWRSAPLSSNSREFVIVGDVIVSGYGFTAEPDFLFLIDARTGQTVQRVDVRTAPGDIVEKGGELFVHCYDIDYTFHMT